MQLNFLSQVLPIRCIKEIANNLSLCGAECEELKALKSNSDVRSIGFKDCNANTWKVPFNYLSVKFARYNAARIMASHSLEQSYEDLRRFQNGNFFPPYSFMNSPIIGYPGILLACHSPSKEKQIDCMLDIIHVSIFTHHFEDPSSASVFVFFPKRTQ